MVFFFFKQRASYDMRISDWSSAVCSSDLADNPDYDVQQNALLRIGPHDDACKPAQNAAHDNNKNEVHRSSSFFSPRRYRLVVANRLGTTRNRPIGSRNERQRKRNTFVSREPHTFVSRSEAHTSELKSLMRTSYAVFRLQKNHTTQQNTKQTK